MDQCSICESGNADETHHNIPQYEADENGFVGHIPVNARYNLIKICKKCHSKITAEQMAKKNGK